ncbi:hypothetical protein MTO96_039968 [Rhipicephalus appendiculatus]
MDRLKTKRAARRAEPTRVINEAKTLLQSDGNDRTTISKFIGKRVASRDELRKINAELEDVIPVEELETEYESAAYYDDQTLETLTRLRCRLEDLSIGRDSGYDLESLRIISMDTVQIKAPTEEEYLQDKIRVWRGKKNSAVAPRDAGAMAAKQHAVPRSEYAQGKTVLSIA